MATLLLTAVGTVLGGPLGGTIGALAGQAVDRGLLFKPRGREGPRLTDLDVQSSTYGSQVPKIFGTMRVAGTVIWATDIKERRKRSGGGKGQPSVTTYSYSASFAVALSSRQAVRVGRIWADGNLLRGAAGDWKTQLGGFRLMTGDPDQSADQLIASAQGTALTPAYRGMAYAIFEDLQLEDYGNHIPSLTFELIADEGPVRVAEIAAGLSAGLLSGSGEEAVSGYAASGESVAQAVAPLLDAFDLEVGRGAQGLLLHGAGAAEGHVPAAALASRVNGRTLVPVTAFREAAELAPRSVALRYYDAARDYQAGLQRAARPGAGRADRQIELPAVIPAAQAKALAAARVAALWKGRTRTELLCGWSQLPLVAAHILSVEGSAGRWRLESWEWEGMALRFTLRQAAAGTLPAGPASPGSAVREEDLPHGPTVLMLADLPVLNGGTPSAPSVVAAAAGPSAGWRSAALYVDSGEDMVPIGRTAAPAVMGTCLSVPAGGQAELFDDSTRIDVELLGPAMTLAGASDEAMGRGANLCRVGEELLQFGCAVQTGPRQYRLTRLLRGRRGTEWAMGAHVPGEAFLLIEEESLLPVPDSHVRSGSTLSLLALGLGDMEPAGAQMIVAGQALQPPSPVHLKVDAGPDGGRMIRWARRSRAGWTWEDGIDAPLAEEAERYLLRVLAGATVLRSVALDVPWHAYAANLAEADLTAGGGMVLIEVAQIGTRGVSRPATLSMTI